MSEQIYLTTGELAEMLGISKQTVIYYDKIGLISPARRNGADYRYYTLAQADELDTILTFRNLGVPIKTVKDYLYQKSSVGCIALLEQQHEKVSQELWNLERTKCKIEKRLSLLRQAQECKDFTKLEFHSLKEERYLIQPCKGMDDKSFMEGFLSICRIAKKLQIDFENPICNIMRQEELMQEDFDHIAFFGILLPDFLDATGLELMVRPAGLYAEGYHKGAFDEIGNSYKRIIQSIRESGYKICGDAFEMDLLSTLTSADPDTFLRKIRIPVKSCETEISGRSCGI